MPCDIASDEKRPIFLAAAIDQSRLGIPSFRVTERPKDHIPKRKVAVVVAVHTPLVMKHMAFGANDQKANPARRTNVGMLEERCENADQYSNKNSHRIDTKNHRNHQRANKGERSCVQWVEPKSAPDINALSAMMRLVKMPP